MSGRFTPGPWTAHPPRGDDPYADGEKYHWVVRAPSTNGAISFQLCALNSMNRHKDGNDARLIAAAPDLLEACKAFIAYNNQDASDGIAMMLAYHDAVNSARAAIAKATS